MYAYRHSAIVASSFDSDLLIFNLLYSYFYNAYFSVIVLKLALKLIDSSYKLNRSKYLRFAYAGFTLFQLLIGVALAYSILSRNSPCLGSYFGIQTRRFWWPML